MELADHLSAALSRLAVTDVALGWRLEPTTIAAVRPRIPPGVTVWRWVPILTDSGPSQQDPGRLAVGVDGQPPSPFQGSADFRFVCPDHDEVIEASLARAAAWATEIDADGVLLDRIRWHSASRSPTTELTCFCGRSRMLANGDGLDLRAVARELASASGSRDGRRAVVAALLGDARGGALAEFLTWRSERITRTVSRLVEGLQGHALRSALDVFTPALARSVGQDLAALGAQADWCKSMTYLDANGPASLPYELKGYADWLTEVGDDDAPGFIGGLLGIDPPSLAGAGSGLAALRSEMSRLADMVGPTRAVVGLDAVQIAGVCEIRDADLSARIEAVVTGGLGIAPSWDLRFIGPARIALMAQVPGMRGLPVSPAREPRRSAANARPLRR
jgi:hypothetical protein